MPGLFFARVSRRHFVGRSSAHASTAGGSARKGNRWCSRKAGATRMVVSPQASDSPRQQSSRGMEQVNRLNSAGPRAISTSCLRERMTLQS